MEKWSTYVLSEMKSMPNVDIQPLLLSAPMAPFEASDTPRFSVVGYACCQSDVYALLFVFYCPTCD